MSVYQELKAAGVPLDSHESDLYALVTPASQKIVHAYEHFKNVRVFANKLDGQAWYDIPFAFDPWWPAHGQTWGEAQRVERARQKEGVPMSARCSGRCYHDRGHAGPCADAVFAKDNEDACMHDGCPFAATRFESVYAHWHDWVWCNDHARGRATVALYSGKAVSP